MLNSLNDTIKRHLADNIWIYSIIILMFVLGITIGALAVNGIDDMTGTDARLYLEGFLDYASRGELQSVYILKQSIKFNLYFALLMFLSGLIYLGMFFIPLLTVFRGFCIGFSIAFLTESFGRTGFVLSLGSILPQNIIFVPVIIIIGVVGLNYSLYTFRCRYLKKIRIEQRFFSAYALSAFVLFTLLIAGSIVEAYITSLIVKLITSYMT